MFSISVLSIRYISVGYEEEADGHHVQFLGQLRRPLFFSFSYFSFIFLVLIPFLTNPTCHFD